MHRRVVQAGVLWLVLGLAAAAQPAVEGEITPDTVVDSAPDDEGGAAPALQPDTPSGEAVPTGHAAAVDPATLAQMRGDLAVLGRALQSLRAELVASGPAGFTAAGGTAAIERMDRMEAQIASLTGQVEQLRNRVEAAVAEAGNRAGDIEFRLCELDPGCDLGALTTAQMDDSAGAGGGVVGVTPAQPAAVAAPPLPTGTPAENADFDPASAALTAGDNARAAGLFADFVATHPGSVLAPEAMFLRGQALAAAGDAKGAAGAWLEAFTAAPAGPRAPQALLALSGAMAEAGRTEDACLFYTDLPTRFPAAPEAQEAARRAEALKCAGAVLPGEADAPAVDAPAVGGPATGAPVDPVIQPAPPGNATDASSTGVPPAPAAPADNVAMDPEEAADLADGQ